jgi:8-oxo-dGTP pyrophosphatase MutT (NUDIX family)
MIYHDNPEDFKSKFEIACCLLEYNGEILLLLRNIKKPEGGTWCLPGGKVDKGESLNEAVLREIGEETGYKPPKNSKLIHFGKKLYVRYPAYDFIYNIFYLPVTEKPFVKINLTEHTDFNWLKPIEALRLPLIPDLDYCLKLFYKL